MILQDRLAKDLLFHIQKILFIGILNRKIFRLPDDGKIKTTEAKNENFQDGMALFEAGDFKGAKLKFNRVSMTAANYLQATEYLQKINSVEKQVKRDSLLSLRAIIYNRFKLLSEALFVCGTNPNVQAFFSSA